MRFKTFISLVGLGLVTVALLLGWLAYVMLTEPTAGPAPVSASPAPAPGSPTAAASNPASPSVAIPEAGGAQPLRPVDREALAYFKETGWGGKRKDVSKGRPYKIDLYQDAGHPTVNRLKLDLNRNNRWDEKWTLEADGTVKREVAPADDERYTQEYRLHGDVWEPYAR